MKTNTDKFLSSPVTWALLVILSVSGVIYIYFNYGKANSIIHLDITMDRHLALDQAKTIAGKLKLGPDNYKQAAAFITDSHFQNFAELEGGGIDSVVSCSEKGFYMPFVWKVRHFREHDAREVAFFFTPAGKTYGFSEKLPESEKGASLSAEEAQKIAEQNAVAEWGGESCTVQPC
jgi:hypothetical protein